MGGYTKNIAVIKGLKDGFSSDGGALTGIIKAERYGTNLRVEVTFVNFAPLSEGRFVTALSDGKTTLIVEDGLFEGASALDTSGGFAALVCYVNGQVSPVASAVSGNFHGAALGIREEVERAENIKAHGSGIALGDESPHTGRKRTNKGEQNPVYEDEAIAEVNYYEFAETDESGDALRKSAQKEENGRQPLQNAAHSGTFQKEQGGVSPLSRGGNFYSRMQAEIEGIFEKYPKAEELERTVENSRWAKISYGEGKYYVFGVLYGEGRAQYLCYGVPTAQSDNPPESMRGLASFIPSTPNGRQEGFWVMYQDAETGASLKIDGV